MGLVWEGRQRMKAMNEPKPKRIKKQYDEAFRRTRSMNPARWLDPAAALRLRTTPGRCPRRAKGPNTPTKMMSEHWIAYLVQSTRRGP
jgi:hypothetical protein